MAKDTGAHLSSTTQTYLDILDITNDLVILKDGSAAMVLQVSAINFGLLSEPEQDAIIYAYAALINSLSFPIQILIKSKPKDVTNYLHYIDEQLTHAPNEVRRQQISAYRQFVANMITEQNVLDKTFYVVLPLTGLELGLASAANPLAAITPKKATPVIDKHYVIEKSLNILGPRRDHVISQFARLGLRAQMLNTKDLIYLFYITYNPQASEGTKVVNTNDYTTALIAAQGVNLPNFAATTATPNQTATAPVVPTETTASITTAVPPTPTAPLSPVATLPQATSTVPTVTPTITGPR